MYGALDCGHFRTHPIAAFSSLASNRIMCSVKAAKPRNQPNPLEIITDPLESAKAAGLRYVTDAKGVRTGAMEEAKWDAPADDPFAEDAGCR